MTSLEIYQDDSPALVPTQLRQIDVAAVKQRLAAIQDLCDLMIDGVHYGPPFPGSEKKSLLQAGAEFLLMSFELTPAPAVIEEDLGDGHRRFIVEGSVLSGGRDIGRMTAECSTMEPKYRYRNSGRICPTCSQEAIMMSKYPDKVTGAKGWYCNKKAGGCGAQYDAADPAVADQSPGRVENPDPAELWHTCRMMAQKRWLVGIARRTLALSARFVDAEAARAALFDWKRAKSILRAMPGEREEKWGRVVAHCLRTFGKPPEEINNLEGAVLLPWLSRQVSGAGDLDPRDFMESPEAPNGGASKVTPATETEAPEAPAEEPEARSMADGDRKEFAKALKSAKLAEGAVALFGASDTWTTDDAPRLRKLLARGNELVEEYGPPDGWAAHTELIRGAL